MSTESGAWRKWWRRVLEFCGAQSPPVTAPPPRQAERPALVASVPAARPKTEIAYLHVGIDFGTRFTKVCFRDLGSDRSEVVTFARAGEIASLETALLSSRLAFDGERVVAGVQDAEGSRRDRDAIPIDFIKIRLAQLDLVAGERQWVPAPVAGCEGAAVTEALATFYLATVMARTCRWVETNRPDLLEGRRPQWSFSVGLPVKYVDSPAQRRFERVLRAAALLAQRGVPDAPSLAELIAAVPELMRSAWATSGSVQPEIAAAVRSFTASPRALEGVYLYVDVGAGTIDGASFRFYRPAEARAQLNFYCGDVQPLGVTAVASLVAEQTKRSAAEVERLLFSHDGRGILDSGLEEPRRALNRLVAGVILAGKRADPRGWADGLDQLAFALHRRRGGGPRRNRDVPLFIGGGGSASPFYRAAILSTYKANNLYSAGVSPYSLEELLLPDDLAMNGLPAEHFHRFAVAYGLSIPPDEAPEIGLPSSDTDVPPPRRSRPMDAPSYEDTKDLE